eukprot:XP_025003219.1 nucleoporin-like protein 2 [Gallus gallus]
MADVIAEDMATWESSGQWMFRVTLLRKASLMFQALESSRLRRCVWSIITGSANNNTGYYINSVNQLVQQWRKRLQELKALNGLGKSRMTNTNIIQPAVFQHTAGGGGGSGAPAAVTQPPVIANSTSGGSGDGGGLSGASGFGPAGNNGAVLSQNAFSALSSAQPADGQRDGQQSLLDVIAEDMATWESSGQWMFSCYSPEKGKPNVPGFGEFSAEEVRLEYYNCSANNNTGYYINSVNQLVQQWRKRLQELKALNGSGKAPMQNGGGGGGGMGRSGSGERLLRESSLCCTSRGSDPA